jgi:hypothetical protein
LRFKHLVTNLIAVTALLAGAAKAQTTPTASKRLEISTFGGITGTYTGLSGGRNLGITAGVDIGIRSYFGFRPYFEGRGTYPIDDGQIDSQKDALGGVRIERLIRPNVSVYGDFLLGRGEIDYQNGGYPSPSGNFLFLKSTSNVYSPGAGAEYRLTKNFSALADVQFQRWATPATPSGSIWATPITVGVRYRIDFNRKGYPSAPRER